MKNRLTVKQVIKKWVDFRLSWKNPIEFSCVEVQDNIVDFGKQELVWHTPDYYSREWRQIREDIRCGVDYGFTVEEFYKEGERIKWYRVTKS